MIIITLGRRQMTRVKSLSKVRKSAPISLEKKIGKVKVVYANLGYFFPDDHTVKQETVKNIKQSKFCCCKC